MDSTAHRHAAFQVAVGVGGEVGMVDETGVEHRGPALVVPPMVRHRLLAGGDLRVFFVEPHSVFADRLRRLGGEGISVVSELRDLRVEDLRWGVSGELDPRLVEAMRLLSAENRATAGLVPEKQAISRLRPEKQAISGLRPGNGATSRLMPGNRAARGHVSENDALPGRAREGVAMSEIAAQVGLSPQRLRTLAREQLGMPLARWRIWQRLSRAAEALREGRTPADAAAVAGFADQAHFHRRMREMIGLTPTAVARAVRP
ncbi:helix-turn-helix domain-containing protein [Nonomuraea sp. NPDC050663]|uniref:helix-turn-helix domain-containing protein n=1 Tax=Nonomuraea sp. NPDC050663 TaxID=3364370 RepID=UPI0037BA48F5